MYWGRGDPLSIYLKWCSALFASLFSESLAPLQPSSLPPSVSKAGHLELISSKVVSQPGKPAKSA